MKTRIMLAAAVAAFVGWTACAAAPVTPSVGLKLARPTVNGSKSEVKPKGNTRGTKTSTETKNDVYTYAGKITCNPAKGTTASVSVEAYFITKDFGKGTKEELSAPQEIGTFEFGGENPSTQSFTVTSPAISQTTVKTTKSGHGRHNRGGGGTSSSKTGERLMGVVLRAKIDGKVVKVISEPSNSVWISAAKKDTFELK